MKIDSTSIQLTAQAAQTKRLEQQQRAAITLTSDAPVTSGTSTISAQEATYQYSAEERSYLYSNSTVSTSNGSASQAFSNSRLLTEVTEIALSGTEAVNALTVRNGQPIGPPLPGFSGSATIEFSRYQFMAESQDLTFSSQGAIKTEDGREIDFSLYLQLNQKATHETTESFVMDVQRMQDPLVINFGADSVSLTDQYFEFDLEGDGENEVIASLASGSGYLVLDRNGNGNVDDGSELFGPRTGQGFLELAEFDSDGNLWIDENDEVFSQLQLWVSDESGQKELRTLKEVGVGAIYLGHAEGHFNLHSSSGAVLGDIKSSGIVVMEDGNVRTIQEIDLADLSEPSQDNMSVAPVLDNNRQPANDEAESLKDLQIIAISNALERLDEIRAQQRAYSDSLLNNRLEGKSPLTELLEKMEEIRLEMLEKQRSRADRFYREYASAAPLP